MNSRKVVGELPASGKLRSTGEAANFLAAGDLGPEGIIFISAKNSPNDKPLVVIANEISGTTTIFQIDRKRNSENDDDDDGDEDDD